MSAATAVAATPRGRLVWHDLITTDMAGAVSFYTKLVGWGTAPFDGTTPYTMWTTGDAPLGGLGPLPAEAAKAGAPPHWIAYAAVPDVDDTTKLATGRGAKVMVPPTDIPTVGRFAMLADPQGAQFAAFTALNHWPGHEGPAQVGEFSWHELGTSDGQAAFGFYHALFGWEKTDAMDMGPDGIYQMFGREGLTLGGIYSVSGAAASHPAWLHYIRVPDVDRAAQQIAALGGRVVRPPMDVPGGSRIVVATDPQGATFALHSTAQ